MAGSFFSVWLGMTVSNYLWQIFGAGDYHAAFERTFFQAIALVAAWIICRNRGVS